MEEIVAMSEWMRNRWEARFHLLKGKGLLSAWQAQSDWAGTWRRLSSDADKLPSAENA
jgi:hypothetical protein